MRIFKFLSVFTSVFFMIFIISCQSESFENQDSPEFYYQDINQLYIPADSDLSEKNKNKNCINYDSQYARWISYLSYSDIMLNKSEDEFKNLIAEMLEDYKNQGINTIYFQVRAFGDSYYKSQIFPTGTFLNENYDPLEILISEAHRLNISVHAWVNPLRCQTAEEFKNLSDDFITKKWFNDFQGKYICNVDGRMWLNPAYDEVLKLISDGIIEIIENYNIDGIHIDDYFYPTKDESFDLSAFEDSGKDNLRQWRIDNINKLVSKIYSDIKSYDENILFGISPQGNIDIDYDSQFADVKEWCCNDGYCDYIVPQIYFGFNNDTCPFEITFKKWYDMTKDSDISLVIGLAAYKQGKEDKWAGSGKNEWIDDPDVIEKQIEFIEKYENVGFSLYY